MTTKILKKEVEQELREIRDRLNAWMESENFDSDNLYMIGDDIRQISEQEVYEVE